MIRRITTVTIILVAALVTTGCQTAKPHESLLFVQTADSARLTSVSEDEGTYTLELHDVADRVTYFTDRPYRKTGTLPTSAMIGKWDHGRDDFAEDPPNAAISVAGSDSIWVLALSEPKLDGSTLTYSVKLLQESPHFASTEAGDPPATAEHITLFIDNLWYSGGNPSGNPGRDPMNRPDRF